jgi:hypothetical protein
LLAEDELVESDEEDLVSAGLESAGFVSALSPSDLPSPEAGLPSPDGFAAPLLA